MTFYLQIARCSACSKEVPKSLSAQSDSILLCRSCATNPDVTLELELQNLALQREISKAEEKCFQCMKHSFGLIPKNTALYSAPCENFDCRINFQLAHKRRYEEKIVKSRCDFSFLEFHSAEESDMSS